MQADFLRNLGCDHAQGHYFSKPLTAEQFVQFVVDFPSPEETAISAAA